jgi:hypothetical protein
VPLARHVLELTQSKNVVIGLDFTSFSAEYAGNTELDKGLLTSNHLSYFVKRILVDLAQALSFKATQNSIISIFDKLNDIPYDGSYKSMSIRGQHSEARMLKITEERGKTYRAFRKKMEAAFIKPSLHLGDEKSWRLLDGLLTEICEKNIVIRLYVHPVHALVTDVLRQNGSWQRFEQWKSDLALRSRRYQQQQCDIKVVDFSGYNSITTETIRNLLPTTSLQYYWEASHYKSKVGELILKRLFSLDDGDLPSDFGRELREDTITEVLAAIREEQTRYITAHADEIALAQQWANSK